MSVECPQCGETFGTERAKNIHRGKSHDKDAGKPWMHEEKFRRLWVDEGLTQAQMAERWGCARGTVSRWASRHDVTRHYNDPEELKRLYHEEDMSQRDIADHLGRHYITIQNKFKEFGIEVPNPRDPTRPMYHGFYRKHKDVVGSEYEVMSTSIDGSNVRFRVHRLIALAHGIITFEEFLDPDTIVHHETQHGLDNRPESLRKMSRSEHMSHHRKLQSR